MKSYGYIINRAFFPAKQLFKLPRCLVFHFCLCKKYIITYTTFIMADSSGRMVTTKSERGQWGHNKTNMAALATLGASLLEENDIPGASLCGRKPSELKNEELKFWLKCRGDPAKGLKTKAELVKRWEITLFPLPSSLASRCLRRFEVHFIPLSEWKSTSGLVEIKVLLTLIPTGCIPKESSNEEVHRRHQA